MSAKYKILIIDDHPMFRDGLKTIVRSGAAYEIAGEAGNCAEGLAQARSIKPDLVIVDISLPDGNGIDLARDILALAPQTKVVMLSMHSKVDFIATAFQAGVSGYLAKESSREQLLQALDAVMAGRQYLDGSLSPRVVTELLARPNEETRTTDAAYGKLSRREQQVLRLLAEGHAPAVIAERLFISRKTVENHRTNILAKLGIKSPVALVRYAARLGLIDLETEE
ncbi:two component transcriptional regulator, LuxR family [Humidesulfovibrio mexicanus]|uniref:Two component transcriptional regulator, LuxR family n=1 Tax=Humidesulfovibrio mexicanus TaxID=147047 RepID=A0A238YW76_9BACT|nr:response regulator transcription factor [Humidesulfovibrio mexicanus]SNR75387.1 two component transcriptional regulator, LuxR family [Humidesulfovibrio mexicanus]